jgi:FMN phosphatase YigB (HAD superfamily)
LHLIIIKFNIIITITAMAINWQQIRCVIFDVDGTLYTQKRLRGRMLRALVQHYSLRPWKLRELLILQQFRAQREQQTAYAGASLEIDQYEWVAKGNRFPVRQVREVVDHWMFRHPLPFLAACRFPGVSEFFTALRAHGITIGIYSDYPAHTKLAALELTADIVVSSTDSAVNRLKPNPQGLHYIMQQLGLLPEQCLFIGDRPELDGACAEAAGMPHLIVAKQPFSAFTFYHTLTHQLHSTHLPVTYEPVIHPARP